MRYITTLGEGNNATKCVRLYVLSQQEFKTLFVLDKVCENSRAGENS